MTAPNHRAALLASDLFRAMDAPTVDAVLARATVRRIAAGEDLLHRGDPASGLFVVLEGRLRVSVVSAEGGEVMLGMLGPGEVIGEMSLLDGQPRSADVAAIEPSALLFVERAHVMELLRRDAALCLRLMAVLCRRLRDANEAVEDVALLDVPARLGRVLLRLARGFGVAEPGGAVRIGARVSQRDLALLAGTSRETANRELRALEAAGVIGKSQGRIVLLRPDDLEA